MDDVGHREHTSPEIEEARLDRAEDIERRTVDTVIRLLEDRSHKRAANEVRRWYERQAQAGRA